MDWSAVGDYVLLHSQESVSESGLVTETMYAVHSVGGTVPILLSEGDVVVLTDDAVMTPLHRHEFGSIYVIHYNNICAIQTMPSDFR